MRAILRRVAQLVVVLIVVTFFTSVLLEFLPGDPVKTIAPFATQAQRDSITEQLGLDQPFYERYVTWLGNFATGDLGNYYRGPQVVDPVANDAWNGLGVSLQLMLYVQVLTLVGRDPTRDLLGVSGERRLRQSVEHRRVRVHLDPELRARVRARVLPRGAMGALTSQRVRPVRDGSRRTLPTTAVPRHHPGDGPDRDLHPLVAQRHDRDAAGGFHPDGEEQGDQQHAASCGATRSGRRASPC